MKCQLCRREAENTSLCRYHAAAKDALEKGYQAWNDAYSGMSWKEYLNRVKHLESTGKWVREVVNLMGDVELD